MFKVTTHNFCQEFARWTDALEAANSLKPQCQSLLQDVRIYNEGELVWVFSLSHTYPQYIGAGTYTRLARLFVQETLQDNHMRAEDSAPNSPGI